LVAYIPPQILSSHAHTARHAEALCRALCLLCGAQPTFVMYKDKKKVKTITGADTKQLKTAIADLL
jgi:hypothetical protein